jgi:hypothetical protein
MNRGKILIIALIALAIRVALIFIFTGGATDLQIYHYFGEMVLMGSNPYRAPADGPISPHYADMPPLNLGVFAMVLAIHDSPVALRICFALFDALTVIVLGLGLKGSVEDRRFLVHFYAFNPIFLLAWVVVSEDKTIICFLLLATLLLVERGNAIGAVVTAALLAAYKWMSWFFIAPVVTFLSRSRREWLLFASVFLLLFALGHIPYFPDNLVAYSYRSARAEASPNHGSIMLVLSHFGWYHAQVAKVMVVLSIVLVHLLFYCHRLSIREAMVLGVFGAYIFSPEGSLDRILLVSFPMFLIIRLSSWRKVALWGVTLLTTLAESLAMKGLPSRLIEVAPSALWIERIAGKDSMARHAVFMNLLPLMVVAYYVQDRIWNHRHDVRRVAA